MRIPAVNINVVKLIFTSSSVCFRHSLQKFNFIKSPQRQKYAAMVTALDNSVGEIRAALASRGMLQDSVIIFTTDNGGAPYGLNW